MKKGMTVFIMLPLLFLCLVLPVRAETQLYNVTDEAGLLTEEEWKELEIEAEEISEQYDCGIYAVLVNDYTEYTDAEDARDGAEEIYRTYELGVGEEKNGIILLLSTVERDYGLAVFGYGQTAFTEYGQKYLCDHFLDDLADDEWYDGLKDYLNTGAELLEMAENGKVLDRNSDPRTRIYGVLACILLSVLAAAAASFVLRGKMRSVAEQVRAQNYAAAGINLTQRSDRFLHTTHTRVYEEPERSRSSFDGGGSSGRSGKF